jgi:hypothetical protein
VNRWINLLTALILAVSSVSALAQQPRTPPQAPGNEINTLLMHSTFRISGPSKETTDPGTSGTAFILGIPSKANPQLAHMVMITAAHVLNGIDGSTAIMRVRRREADGTYEAYDIPVPIRKNQRPLYVQHPVADVAAMYVRLPLDVPITLISIAALSDDDLLKTLNIHPGDEVFSLGFPLSATGPGGFPILRSAHIASYPLTPMKTVKYIDLDMYVLRGNSGGPVYFYLPNRIYGGVTHMEPRQAILGLLVQGTNSANPAYEETSLNFGVIVPAPFIKETVAMLPASEN